MPRNGTGTFALPTGNPVVDGTAIDPSVHNTTMNDIGAEITNSVARDGQAAMTGALDMGTQRIKNVASATLRSDAVNLGQAQDGSFLYVGTVGGTANAITLTPSPAVPAYVAGQSFVFKAAAANTGATTVAISGLTAKNVTKRGTNALIAGDIPNGGVVCITYDGTQFQVDRVADVVTKTGAETLTFKTLDGASLNTPTITNASASGGTYTNITLAGTTSMAAISGNARATQANMEAPTSNNLVVTPSVMINHPGVAKAWAQFDGTQGTGSIVVAFSSNVSSIVKNGTGDYTINFSVTFSNTSYPDPIISCGGGPGAVYGGRHTGTPTKTATSYRFETRGTGGSVADATSISVHVFGDL